ncbi:TerB family tellurite resistance protein [Flavobacteriaceae bacterium TP-CH-4]|uniref:TerB family tellurite resistance protein n=1 Tax=Pelagihabitans pacificus TaxID=2696054 RepID=A0A967AUH1_9FLAO|nr:TerB family tellurite resistance protein [Pelagihabitans pacificus]NHF60614.1 TerB family tellurite resistance protein [Pelagihabitans pacificus]
MSFLNLFDTGFKKRNQDHFAAIVRVAMSDGVITEDERAFLHRLAARLDITEEEYKKILKDYKSHPINPPTSYDLRLERLYDLARMVYADDVLGEKQTAILERLGIGLGFSTGNISYVVDKALKLVHAGVDKENFMDEIKHMNR